MITFKRIAPGEFAALRDGEDTAVRIINGSLGLSGRDTPNVYGIVRPERAAPAWIGSLAACKKLVERLLTKPTKET
jgi:hypothetical protein